MKYYIILLFLFSSFSNANDVQMDYIAELILKTKIAGRDSGEELNKSYLLTCLTFQSPEQFKLKCDDIISIYYISLYEKYNKDKVILIISDGASVENRYAFTEDSNGYKNIADEIWPLITRSQLSSLLITQTGQSKYTEQYILQVAHSSYRIIHSANGLVVVSGIPDLWEGTKLGLINWNGDKFIFVPLQTGN
jgi:hypothetical protein